MRDRQWLQRISGGGLGRRRAILAAPAFAAGAAVFYALPFEPDRGYMLAAGLGASTVAALAWRLAWARWPTLWLLALALGCVWAMLRADWADVPVLEREGAGLLSGEVAWVEAGPSRPRMELIDAGFERRGQVFQLARARVRLGRGAPPAIGARVQVRAVMRPPPGPVAPGGFDFRRDAYFKGVGAVGFAIGAVETVGTVAPGAAPLFANARARFRDVVYGALEDRPDLAGVVTALTVGDRSGVVDADDDALRASGLAHLLAISGLHLGMAAGFVYLTVRLLLALPHGLALRFPAHKLAAAIAILAAAAYLGMSGAAPPAQRAFVMTLAAMIAIMTDRLRSGLWFIAWAAIVVAVAAPHVVVGPSFQLSFAAATAIVAAYEVWSGRRRDREEPAFAGFGLLRPAAAYVAGVAGASLIATAATAPLALIHFQQAPVYGLVGNLVAMPAMAFVIMPMAMLAGLLAPFGLAAWPLQAMALGVDGVLAVAHAVSSWPGGVFRLPAPPGWTAAAFLIGGALICGLRGPLRALGLVGVLAAAVGLALARPPDVLIADDARIAGVVRGGVLYASSMRTGAFDREAWRRQAGAASIRPLADMPGARCDDRGCAFDLKGRTAVIAYGTPGVATDCRRADVLVLLAPAAYSPAMGCDASAVVVAPRALRFDGAHALTATGDGGLRVETVAARHGGRMWSPPGQ